MDANKEDQPWWIDGIRVLREEDDGTRRVLRRGDDWDWLPKLGLTQDLVVYADATTREEVHA